MTAAVRSLIEGVPLAAQRGTRAKRIRRPSADALAQLAELRRARAARILENLRVMGAHGVAVSLAAQYGVDVDRMVAGDRHKTSAACRHRLWAIIFNTLRPSYPEIGLAFEADHTTVMNGIRKHEARVAAEELR